MSDLGKLTMGSRASDGGQRTLHKIFACHCFPFLIRDETLRAHKISHSHLRVRSSWLIFGAVRAPYSPPQKPSNNYELFSGSSPGEQLAKRTIIVSVLGLQKAGYGEGCRGRKAGRSRLAYKLVLQSVADKFCIGFHIHLFKQAGTVSADSSNAEKKLFGDLFHRLS